MSVSHPDPHHFPYYGISPFTTTDISTNRLLSNHPGIEPRVADHYLRERFGDNFCYTLSGREAIHTALESYGLKKSDLVTVLTTSQNFYISSCVTKEIEKFCQWNREVVPQTRIILVNHEFGYIYPDMDDLLALGLPIIEDCCTTFFSQNTAGKVGRYGDFAVYSFPKFFPVRMGGLLVSNQDTAFNCVVSLDTEAKIYLQKVLAHYISTLDELLYKRKVIFDYGIKRFRQLGFNERFETDDLVVPVAMMLKNNGIVRDLSLLKTELWNRGIESSVFYGEDAFFIPSHQNLAESDVDYFFKVIQSFIHKTM